MDIFLQQILNGLVLGSVYALVALGYTMVYGILGLINFAHGEVVMIGAMVALTVMTALAGATVGLPVALIIALAIAAAIAVCMALAYSIERVAYRPLRNAPRLAALITAIGMSILLQNVAMIIWGRQYQTFPRLFSNAPHTIAGANITDLQIVIILVSGVLMVALLLLVHFTRLGRAMRAVSENQAIAGLMGVNVNKIISATFVIGAALGAVAGVLVAANYSIAHYTMGFTLGLKAFTAAVLGGIGNIPGAMIGGFVLGIVESVGPALFLDGIGIKAPYQLRDLIAFTMLVMVLIFRPQGILGERLAAKRA